MYINSICLVSTSVLFLILRIALHGVLNATNRIASLSCVYEISCVCKHLCLLIFRKRALSLVANLRKMTCNLSANESHRFSILCLRIPSLSCFRPHLSLDSSNRIACPSEIYGSHRFCCVYESHLYLVSTTIFTAWRRPIGCLISWRSFPAKQPRIIGLFCGKWNRKIRHPITPRHPVSYFLESHRMSIQIPWHSTLSCFYLNSTNRIASIYCVDDSHFYLVSRGGGAGVETQKNIRREIGGWGRVPFNETYAPSLSTIYDGA